MQIIKLLTYLFKTLCEIFLVKFKALSKIEFKFKRESLTFFLKQKINHVSKYRNGRQQNSSTYYRSNVYYFKNNSKLIYYLC